MIEEKAYLRNDFEPSIDLNVGETFAHCMADVVVMSVFEPERQQPKSVLKSVLVSQRDRTEETCVRPYFVSLK